MSGSPGPATSFVVPLASQGAPCVVSPTASFSGMSRMAPAAAASATKTQLLQGAPAAAVPAAVAMQTMNIDLSNPQTAAARMLGEPSCSGRMEPKDQLLAPHARQRHEHYHIEPVYDPYKTHKLLFSGALSGAISRTVTAPVDRLKMILQVQDDSKRGMTLREGVQRMHSEGSWTTFFKGNGANVLKIAPEQAMKLTLNDAFKAWIQKDHADMSVWERMAAGGVAGAVAQFITYPLDTIRTRLAVSTHGTYQGILHVAHIMQRSEGLPAFYRGLTPSMIGILPYAGVDIALFEVFKQELFDDAERKGAPPPNLSLLVAGMVSSSIAQVVSYPLALIRTRLQAQGLPGRPLKYRNMADVLQKTIEREGLRGLYKGLLPNIFKLAPAAGIGWYVFEESKRALGLDPRI